MLKELMKSLATSFGHMSDDVIHKHRKSDSEVEFENASSPVVSRRMTINSQHPKRPSPEASPPLEYKQSSMRSRSNSLPRPTQRFHEIERLSTKKCSSHPSNSCKSSPINILVVGAKNVGKSALIVRFITRRFIGDYISGESMTYNYTISDERRRQQVTFLDESAEEDQNNNEILLDPTSLTWADGIIVVYDVGDSETFTYAKNLISFIDSEAALNCQTKNASSTSKPVLLLGNKTDLMKRRDVSNYDAREAVKTFPFWVTCEELSVAESYDDVNNCMSALISQIRHQCGCSPSSPIKENFQSRLGSVFRSSFRSHKTPGLVTVGSF